MMMGVIESVGGDEERGLVEDMVVVRELLDEGRGGG